MKHKFVFHLLPRLLFLLSTTLRPPIFADLIIHESSQETDESNIRYYHESEIFSLLKF
ncbi:hypothetical protein T11_14866 [Trichinella zimbabwensis]|uniref:Uncharacterized protein n=1 Tax=Trichinella zimbabwensis TaxID=268475 RepID=A0A0V1GJ53_9BILA|nr:hypothetical protein T11_14866 [Trichinella zimbabwensis]